MASSNNFPSELAGMKYKYINLETYKKNGQPVRTPVWFVPYNEKIYLRTDSNSGKVKRIMNNQYVSIAACDLLAKIKAEWKKAPPKLQMM
jgi:hypothetical protein